MSHGIHHVTAISGEPRRNLTFYARHLGLRLVKKTVYFDDPSAYHLYYGDAAGTPGTIITFFPWADAPAGQPGAGELQETTFRIPADSIGFWTARLANDGVTRTDRFGEPANSLGSELKLPRFLQHRRGQIEGALLSLD